MRTMNNLLDKMWTIAVTLSQATGTADMKSHCVCYKIKSSHCVQETVRYFKRISIKKIIFCSLEDDDKFLEREKNNQWHNDIIPKNVISWCRSWN